MKRIGVIGAGQFGTSLAESLVRRGVEVLLLDRDAQTVQRMSEVVTSAVEGDALDQQVLVRAGFQECDTVVVAIGNNVQSSVIAVMNLKEIGVKRVVGKASSQLHAKVLERLGADLVVHPDRERAQRLARSLLARSALDFHEVSEGASVIEMKAPDQFVGRSLAESGIRKAYGVTVLAIKRAPDEEGKRDTVISPTADDLIREGDTLVLYGPDLLLDALAE
jgi:trk system potassium uptake protein TrkA